MTKGSAIIDHFTDNVVEDYKSLDFEFYDEHVLAIKDDDELNNWWTVYFDGVMNILEKWARAVIIYPEKKLYHVLMRL